jgi:Mg-chelatase subunit ChlD
MRASIRNRNRRGAALIYAMIAFAVICGFVALGAEVAKVRAIKAELRNAVDGATHAACTGLDVSPAEARLRAKTIAAGNLVNGQPLTLLDSDIELGKWNTSTRSFSALSAANESTADAVRITGRLAGSRGTAIPLIFLPVLGGQNSTGISAMSVSAKASVAQDIVIVQDVSGSFSDEIAEAKTGDINLLDSQKTVGGTSSLGVVAFTGSATTISSIKNVKNNYSTIKSSLNTLGVGTSGMPSTISGTDIAAGIEKALSLFNTTGQTSPTRSMVIVSDGEPTSSWFGAHPGKSASQLLALAQSDADDAWDAGINVSVVFWDSANDATASANLKTLIRGRGVFVHVTDPNKLAEAIGNVVARTLLVQ